MKVLQNTKKIHLLNIIILLFWFASLSIKAVDVDGNCDHTQDYNDSKSNIILTNVLESDPTFGPVVNRLDYPSLRIHSDYSLLKETQKKSYIAKELIPPLVDYFQKALKIKRPLMGPIQAPSQLPSDYCNISASQAFNEGVEVDLLLIVVSSVEFNTGFAARSSVCFRSISGRPIVSKLRFNTENLPLPKNQDPLIHERYIYLAMHEVIHSLGFLRSSYNYFVDEFGNKRQNHFRSIILNGQNRTILDLEPLTERLRQHFGCPSLPGALLEDNGGVNTMNSHFERRLFLHEVMTAGILGVHRISEFTLAVLEGSGWYVPDYSYAEPFSVGEGQGCEFWEGSDAGRVKSMIEYCSDHESRGCTATGRGGGDCIRDSKSDGYSYYRPKKIYDCENPDAVVNARLKTEEVFGRGSGSKCFSGTLSNLTPAEKETTTFCFTYNCRGSGLDTQLEIYIGNKTIICEEEGQINVENYSGKLNCPDPLSYCKTIGKNYCPRNCMGRGECTNNECRCQAGYTGTDCAIILR